MKTIFYKLKTRFKHLNKTDIRILSIFGSTIVLITLLSLIIRLSHRSSFRRIPFSPWTYQSQSPTTTTSVKATNQEAVINFKYLNSSVQFELPIANLKISRQDDQVIFATSPIEIRYQTLANGLKEDIILKKIPSTNQFTSTLKTTNADIYINNDGLPVFLDPQSGSYLFHVKKPFATDAAGKITYDVSYEIHNNGQPLPHGKKTKLLNKLIKLDQSLNYSLTIKVNSKWLFDPSRIYPITIDPTVVHDTSSEFVVGTLNRVVDTGASAPINIGTGGTITYSGGYTIHSFLGSGIFTAISSGDVQVLVVAGGGGGGVSGGGGGAGGIVYNSSYSITPGDKTVTIGSGGASHVSGSNSVFDSITATGGGRGGSYSGSGTYENGANGGSGGGGSGGYPTTAGVGGSGTSGQGYRGGSGSVGGNFSCGGGGGANAVGTDAGGGNGGNGTDYSAIFGTSFGVAGVFGGGGGGGSWGATPGVGGSGGGGNGTAGDGTAGIAAIPNTGGGGGGGGFNYGIGGSGGSGIVIIRYPTSYADSSPSLTSYYQELPSDINTISLWHLNESAGTTISSATGLGHTGSLGSGTSAPSIGVNSLLNVGAHFDVGDYINLGSSPEITGNDFSVEMWLKPDSFSTVQVPFHKNGQYSIAIQSSGYVAWADSSNWSYANFGYQNIGLSLNKWQHLAVTKNNGIVSLFLDGNLKFSQAFGSSITSSTNPTFLGCYSTNGTSCTSSYFDGTIDELRLSNVARSPEEIRLDASRRPYSTYTSSAIDLGQAVSSWDSISWTEAGVNTGDGETLYDNTSLFAKWDFNSTSGGTATVSAGSCVGCTGTLTGFSNTTAQDVAVTPASGWTNNNRLWGAGALMFDNVDDYVNVGDIASFDSLTDFTICAWVNHSSLTGDDYIISKVNSAPGGAGVYFLRDDVAQTSGRTDVYKILVNNSTGTTGAYIESYTQSPLGKWTHVCTTFAADSRSNGLRLYINGIEDAAGPVSTETMTSIDSGTAPITIGRYSAGSSNYFSGTMDSLTIYSRVLSASEILSNYQAGSIEFQTRVGSSSDPYDGTWEDWKPTTSETTIDNFDSTGSTWATDASNLTAIAINKIGETAYSTGNDGNCTVNNGTYTLDASIGTTICSGSARTTAYAINTTSTTLNSIGATVISVGSTSGFAVGDEFLIINLQGTTSSFGHVGEYETHYISSMGSTALYFTDSKLKNIYNGTNQKIMVQRIPNFGNVTVGTNSTLTASAWNGTKNGVIFFRSNGTVTINTGGIIHTNALGFRGGASKSAGNLGGDGGESYCGPGATGGAGAGTTGAAGSGAGTWATSGGGGVCGGGGGSAGTGHRGAVYRGGSGGGGSSGYGYGGGGGYGSFGKGGGGNAGDYGEDGGSNSANAFYSGNGGGDTNWGGGGGGGAFGDEFPAKLFLGTGGGSGGSLSQPSGAGGNGGGIIYISANSIGISGSIKSVGASGAAPTDSGGGGGGSGGSIVLQSNTNLIGLSSTDISGGASGSSTAGGIGRLAVIKNTENSQSSVKDEGDKSLQLKIGDKQTDYSNTVAIWHLNETGTAVGTTFYDSSGFNNHAIATSLPSVIDGFSNKGRGFGTTQYIYATTTIPSIRSLEYWVYPTTLAGPHIQLASGIGISSSSTGSLSTIGFTGSIIYVNGIISSTIIPRKWNHVAINIGTTNIVGSSIYLGRFGSNYLSSYLDEVRISNSVRTNDEIQESYRAGRDHYLTRSISSTDLSNNSYLPFYIASDRQGTFLNFSIGESKYANYLPDANTVGFWHFDENDTGTNSSPRDFLKDSSSNGYHATPGTGTSFPEFIQGKIGGARYFNGSDYIKIINEGSSLSLSTYTFDTWVYHTGDTNYHMIFDNRDAAYDGTVMLLDLTTNVFSFNHNASVIKGKTTITPNQWFHLAAVSTGSTLYLYVNGVLDVQSTISGTISESTDFLIGTHISSTSYNWKGVIDEFRISNIARSADEIRQTYEIGARTHPITIDFKASLDSGNLIVGSTDYSFIINSTSYGGTDKTSNLFLGDKIIIKENVGGTEYVAQGTVNSTTSSTGLVTVTSWDSNSTFPSNGFTAHATVFKWQREVFDIHGIFPSHRNSITDFKLSFTDASQGANVWIDNLKSSSGYLTTPSGSNITSSTGYQYFQYRFFPTSYDPSVSPSINSVSLNYFLNTAPTTPTLIQPADNASNQSLIPTFKTVTTDSENDTIQYELTICTNSSMTSNCQTFSQTTSNIGWSGQNVGTSAYSSGSTASFVTLDASITLSSNTTYYWKTRAIDPYGTNSWSETQTTPFSFTTGDPLHRPANCLIEESPTDSGLKIKWSDQSTNEDGFYIDQNIDGIEWAFFESVGAGVTSTTDSAANSGHTYQYRIYPYMTGPILGDWCLTSILDLSTLPPPSTNSFLFY